MFYYYGNANALHTIEYFNNVKKTSNGSVCISFHAIWETTQLTQVLIKAKVFDKESVEYINT